MTDKRIGAVIVCAGKGERSGLPYNKVLHVIGRKTALETVLDVFQTTEVDHVTVVSSRDDLPAVEQITAQYGNVSVTIGGATRRESVFNGLKAHKCDIVVIHDGARPFVTADIIAASIKSAQRYGSGIAAVHAVDTVKRLSPDGSFSSLPRAELYNAQTPQTFRYDEIVDAYMTAGDGQYTDDAEIYAHAGYTPKLIDGAYGNIKITTPADLAACLPKTSRIGIGYDVHRLVPDRKLILGGVEIEYERGLLGHSDADVLTHAVMDALLSAANLPDIGVLFPDTDDRYLGISSMALLEAVMDKIRAEKLSISNISAVIIAQKPKLAAIIPSIRASLAAAMGIRIEQINVSATTTEGLGIVGNGEAIAANASCILTEIR